MMDVHTHDALVFAAGLRHCLLSPIAYGLYGGEVLGQRRVYGVSFLAGFRVHLQGVRAP